MKMKPDSIICRSRGRITLDVLDAKFKLLFKKLGIDFFDKNSKILFNGILKGKGKSFQIDEINEYNEK